MLYSRFRQPRMRRKWEWNQKINSIWRKNGGEQVKYTMFFFRHVVNAELKIIPLCLRIGKHIFISYNIGQSNFQSDIAWNR